MNLKKIGKVFTSKFFGAGPSSYEKRIYLAAVSQRLRNTDLICQRVFKKPFVIGRMGCIQRAVNRKDG